MIESEWFRMFEVLWKGVKGFLTIVGAIITFVQGGIGGQDEEAE